MEISIFVKIMTKNVKQNTLNFNKINNLWAIFIRVKIVMNIFVFLERNVYTYVNYNITVLKEKYCFFFFVKNPSKYYK